LHLFVRLIIIGFGANNEFVSTFVVSWKDAADSQLSVESDALVIPSSIGLEIAGSASRV
jgi:hypothetical protein